MSKRSTANKGLSGNLSTPINKVGGSMGNHLASMANSISRANTLRGAGVTGRNVLGGTIVSSAPRQRRQNNVNIIHPWQLKKADLGSSSSDDWRIRIIASSTTNPRYIEDWVTVNKAYTNTEWQVVTDMDTELDDDGTILGFEQEWEGSDAWVYLEAYWGEYDLMEPTHFKPVLSTEELDLWESEEGYDDDENEVEYQSYARVLIGRVTDNEGTPLLHQFVDDILVATTVVVDGGAWTIFKSVS